MTEPSDLTGGAARRRSSRTMRETNGRSKMQCTDVNELVGFAEWVAADGWRIFFVLLIAGLLGGLAR